MPLICEVCGQEEDLEEAISASANSHLHVCVNCREDRRVPVVSALGEEQA